MNTEQKIIVEAGADLPAGFGVIPEGVSMDVITDENIPTPLISVDDQIKTPALFLLLAPSQTGKTTALKNILYLLRPRFKFMIIYSMNDRLESWHRVQTNDDLRFQSFGGGEYVDNLLKLLEVMREKLVNEYREKGIDESDMPVYSKHPVGEFALILDDQASGEHFHTSKVLDRIATTGRHLGMSTFVTSQKPTLISNTMRMNAQYVFMFRPTRSEFTMFRQDFSGGVYDNRKFLELINRYTINHSILIFNRFGVVNADISSTFLYWRPREISVQEWDELNDYLEIYQDSWLNNFYGVENIENIDQEIWSPNIEDLEQIEDNADDSLPLEVSQNSIPFVDNCIVM